MVIPGGEGRVCLGVGAGELLIVYRFLVHLFYFYLSIHHIVSTDPYPLSKKSITELPYLHPGSSFGTLCTCLTFHRARLGHTASRMRATVAACSFIDRARCLDELTNH
jgi:hypothetical protein